LTRSTVPETRVESLAFQVEPSPRQTPEETARAVIRRTFPRETWVLYPLDADHGEFEAVPAARGRSKSPAATRRGKRRLPVRVSLADAWDLTYRLRTQPEVVYAEPLLTVDDTQQHPEPTARARARAALPAGEQDDPGTADDCEWSLKTLRVPEAWALFGNREPGGDIIVGHPDTGYTPHPEIEGRLRPADGFDFKDDDPDPLDRLVEGGLRNPGHGTGTSSVIISGRGKPAGSTRDAFVSGVAPGASLIPIRTTNSVVLFSMGGLTRAIRHAIAKGAHVVSISLGGPFPSVALRNAVRDAEQAGIIVCCAAGNQVRFVVFPAALDEVVAVAGSRIDDSEWPGSCRGPAVDITAPASSVWRAAVDQDGSTLSFDVRRGSGTSFAVAATAGIAALWLSFHGRNTLIERYGRDRLAGVFKQLLQQTCRTPSGWDTRDFGPGIANAHKLLTATLPPAAPALGLRGLRRRAVSEAAPLEVLIHQLAPAPRSGVVRALADLLHVDEEALPEVLDEVGQELAMRVGLDPDLRARLRDAAMAQSPAPRGARAARPRAVSLAPARRRATVAGASRRLRAQLGQ
jgi:serine protease